MPLSIGVLLLLATCTITLWSAITAGRARTRSTRFTWSVAQAVSFFAALTVSTFAAFVPTHPSDSRMVVIGWWIALAIVGFGGSAILVYGLYCFRGGRSTFGTDLRDSLWIGRSGISRLGGGRPRPL